MFDTNFVIDSAYKGYVFSEINVLGNERTYKFNDKTGSGEMRCINLLPGIQISYNRLNMYSTYQEIKPERPILQIDYCLEGCYGLKLKNNEYVFLGKGELSVLDLKKSRFENSYMPTSKYIGITVFIDIEEANKSLKNNFSFIDIDLIQLRDRLSNESPFLIFKSIKEIQNIMFELYNVEDKIRISYSIIKTIELLLFLSVADTDTAKKITVFSKQVYEATQKCYISIIKNPFDRKSIAELSKKYKISEASLKRCFFYMNGKSIGSFIRSACLEAAADLIKSKPNISIGRISEIAGYANQSKFSKAFKIQHGITPREFRKDSLS